ncbi:hypothetical protein DAI22_01g361500 [Oryza sativa Japonica Group]|nr:hypothetical protein DAI22_01g361500 [Oryza sativa Japonica Group]
MTDCKRSAIIHRPNGKQIHEVEAQDWPRNGSLNSPRFHVYAQNWPIWRAIKRPARVHRDQLRPSGEPTPATAFLVASGLHRRAAAGKCHPKFPASEPAGPAPPPRRRPPEGQPASSSLLAGLVSLHGRPD